MEGSICAIDSMGMACRDKCCEVNIQEGNLFGNANSLRNKFPTDSEI